MRLFEQIKPFENEDSPYMGGFTMLMDLSAHRFLNIGLSPCKIEIYCYFETERTTILYLIKAILIKI